MNVSLDESRVKSIIDFIELLWIPDGQYAGKKRFILQDWQKDIIRQVYGPRYENGERVVRQAVLSLSRKNGKSALCAALLIVHLCGSEAVRNGQIASAAQDRGQAALLFNLAAKMIRMSPELSHRLNIIDSRKTIEDPISGSSYQALSSESKTKHGMSLSTIFYDELGQAGNRRELYDVLTTSQGAHTSPLIWVLSTQAADDRALLSQLIDSILATYREGDLTQREKCFLFTIPDDADVFDEKNWILASPALGTFRSLDDMRQRAESAKKMPDSLSSFKNLFCNQRCAVDGRFITADVWRDNGGEPDMGAFDDYPCSAALDLSSKNDLTALVLSCRDPEGFVHVKPYFWMPGDAVQQKEFQDMVPYGSWVKQGYIDAHDGKVISYGFVAQKIIELSRKYNISWLRFDRWKIDLLLKEFNELEFEYWIDGKDSPNGGLRMIPTGQGFKDANAQVEALQDLLIEGKIRHGMNPPLTQAAASVRITTDESSNRKWSKIKSTGRIDGIVALGMTLVKTEDISNNDLEKALLSRGVYQLKDW